MKKMNICHNSKHFLNVLLLIITLLGVNTNAWAQTYNGSTWYSLYDHPSNQTDGYENTNKTFDVYAPTTKSCTFEWKKTGWFMGYPRCDIYISQSTNGGSSYGGENHAIASPVTTKQDSWKEKTVDVEENFNKIKFRQGGTLSRHFKNVTISLAKHIRLVSGTYGTTSVTNDFGNVEWGTSKSYKVNFRSFLTNGNITVSIVGDDKGDFSFSSTTHGVHSLTKSDNNRSFSVGANMCASENGATNTACSTGVLGRASEYDFTVYYFPKKENVGRSYTGNTVYVNITDGKSTAKVILRGNCVKRNQTIVWDNSAATYNTTDNITYNAVANDAISGTASGVSVTYAPTSGSPAYMTGNALQIVTSGNTTITASAAANTYYNAATNVTKKITINKVTPTVTWPEIASGLKYNESCAVGDKVSDHWTGGSAKDDKNTPVSGTFVCDAYLVPANTSYSVTFNPTNTNWYNSTSTTISGIVAKGDQTIDWPLADVTTNPATEYATGQLMGATATSGQDVVYYTTSDASIATIVDGRLNVITPNASVTITAHADADDNWNAAPERTITFTTKGANPNQTTEVTASGITYGQTLSASNLTGNVKLDGVVIPGTLSWVDPAIMPNAGTASHMVLFTPDNTAAYSSVYFEVSVTVAKATPVITWNIGNILREQVRYSHFVESSNKEADLSYETNSALLSITDGVLTTGEVANKQTGLTITVKQTETSNYKAIDVTKTVAIYPKARICLPIGPMTEDEYNQAKVAQDGNVNWCNTNENGAREDYILGYDVTYTQRQGIALGSWEEGLSGLGDAIINWASGRSAEFAYTNKSVDFFFSGIPNTISFDVESQAVTTTWPTVTWNASARNWHLYVSGDGENYTEVASRNGDGNVSYTFTNENVRFVRIAYHGNFTGFIKNLRITQKKYISSSKSSLAFGTEENPLQEPQAITLSYSSLGVCGGSDEDAITITSSNPAFYVDEETITENVGIEQSGSYTIRVRCNDVNQSGKLTFTSNDGTSLEIPVHSTKPDLTTAHLETNIFQTGTEHNPVSGTAYRTQRTHNFEACFNGSTPLFDTLYIYGVSESAVDTREWEYSPAKGYKVPVVTSENVHTPCFVYKKDGAQYTYVRTFDAATTTLNVADSKTRVLVGYRLEGPATTAIQLSAGAAVSLNNTEIVATNAAIAVNGNASIAARGANIVSSASNAAVQLSGAATLAIEDNWKTAEASGMLALRPAAGYPSIDLGSANGRVDINGTQLELHNATNMAIAHMDGTTEKFDGEVHINDGSVGGAATLGMPKLTFIDGGTFNDGTIAAYTLKGVAKRPRNSRGEIVSRQTMAPAALAAGYSWYGQEHLALDEAAKVNPMLMDEEVWIFTGDAGVGSDVEGSWNKGAGLPTENDDVLINAPMVVSGGELKVKSLTINWEDKGKGIPAVTIKPDGGLTVGEGGVDGIKLVNMVDNLVLEAGTDGLTKGQTGFLRIHPESAEPMPEATVELYSIGYYDYDDKSENIAKWQYVGSPLASSDVLAKTVYRKNWVYAWNEATNEWSNQRATFKLSPFVGFATTQRTYAEGIMLTYTGQIVSSETNATIPLAYSGKGHGENVIANSFVAPIDITKFEDEDFVNVDSTIYIFNTGSRSDEEAAKATKAINAPGQYLAIPIGSARLLKGTFGLPTIIAPMQGFCVHAVDENAEIKLNYEKLVWNGDYENNAPAPLRAKSRYSEENPEDVGAIRISLNANGWTDHLFMIESEQFNTKYESAYDARKWMGDELNIFAIEDDDYLAVNATNSIDGTRIGVRTGEEMTYTMTFSHINSEENWMLWDKEAGFKMLLSEDVEYTFNAAPNSEITERFQIIAADIPAVTTGVDEVESEVHIQKFIKDNQLYILKDGVLYNASGAVVRK